MSEEQAGDTGADESADAPTALQEAHAGTAKVMFDRDGLGVDGDVKGTLGCSVENGEEEEKRKAVCQSDAGEGEDVEDGDDANNSAAGEAGDEMAGGWHGEDSSAYEAEEDFAEGSVSEAKILFEDGDVGGPQAEARSIDKEESCQGPFWALEGHGSIRANAW